MAMLPLVLKRLSGLNLKTSNVISNVIMMSPKNRK
jgi:hypothetical protein